MMSPEENPVRKIDSSAPVRIIDWSGLTNDELAEIFDALYERNDAVVKATESLRIRLALKTNTQSAFKEAGYSVAGVSKKLIDSLWPEIEKRYAAGKIEEKET